MTESRGRSGLSPVVAVQTHGKLNISMLCSPADQRSLCRDPNSLEQFLGYPEALQDFQVVCLTQRG